MTEGPTPHEFIKQNCLLLIAAGSAAPEATVPTCPEWTTTNLVIHLEAVYRYALIALRENLMRRPEPLEPDTDAVAALEATLEELLAELDAISGDTAVWNPCNSSNPHWWTRRMGHETLIHRVDAELAAGHEITSINPSCAVDSIDEMIDTFFKTREKWRPGDGASVHIHCTDVPGEWLLVQQGDDLIVTKQHAKGDLAIRGSAQDLLLFSYGRGGPANLDTFGNSALLDLWTKTAI
jgi:uncharacterized protein (TIGR03083 family)